MRGESVEAPTFSNPLYRALNVKLKDAELSLCVGAAALSCVHANDVFLCHGIAFVILWASLFLHILVFCPPGLYLRSHVVLLISVATNVGSLGTVAM